MKDLLLRIYSWLHRAQLYAVLDPADNSVTLSRRVWEHIGVFGLDKPKAFAFYVTRHGRYAFTVNPGIQQETQLADIQYNDKHRCIGFETLNPTVSRIFYDYGISVNAAVSLSVSVRHTKGMTYYEILPPHV